MRVSLCAVRLRVLVPTPNVLQQVFPLRRNKKCTKTKVSIILSPHCCAIPLFFVFKTTSKVLAAELKYCLKLRNLFFGIKFVVPKIVDLIFNNGHHYEIVSLFAFNFLIHDIYKNNPFDCFSTLNVFLIMVHHYAGSGSDKTQE